MYLERQQRVVRECPISGRYATHEMRPACQEKEVAGGRAEKLEEKEMTAGHIPVNSLSDMVGKWMCATCSRCRCRVVGPSRDTLEPVAIMLVGGAGRGAEGGRY